MCCCCMCGWVGVDGYSVAAQASCCCTGMVHGPCLLACRATLILRCNAITTHTSDRMAQKAAGSKQSVNSACEQYLATIDAQQQQLKMPLQFRTCRGAAMHVQTRLNTATCCKAGHQKRPLHTPCRQPQVGSLHNHYTTTQSQLLTSNAADGFSQRRSDGNLRQKPQLVRVKP